MYHRQLKLLFLLATLGASSIALGAASAFGPNGARSTGTARSIAGGVLEEILVTARRRDESSMAVPMTLTVIDGDTLDGLQYRDIDEILGFTPGVLVFTGADGRQLTREQTIDSFEEILEGKHDDVPEDCFYMKGAIDEVIAHHKRLLEEEAKKLEEEAKAAKAS